MEPTDREFEQLLELRTGLRRFLHWSEEQAKAAGITPAQHQLMLTVRGHRGPESPTIGELAVTGGRCRSSPRRCRRARSEAHLSRHVASGFWSLVGLAAVVGGVMRSPFTGIVFSLELTREWARCCPSSSRLPPPTGSPCWCSSAPCSPRRSPVGTCT